MSALMWVGPWWIDVGRYWRIPVWLWCYKSSGLEFEGCIYAYFLKAGLDISLIIALLPKAPLLSRIVCRSLP